MGDYESRFDDDLIYPDKDEDMDDPFEAMGWTLEKEQEFQAATL
jgi:hypothetical protein